jgi:Cu-processing system permease protein
MRDVLTIAWLTWQEARRRKIFLAALLLGVAFILLYGVGAYLMVRDLKSYRAGWEAAFDAGFNFIVMAGLYVVSFLGVVLAVLTSVGTLSGEINSHTVQCLVTKPFRRVVIVLGKWLGLLVMLGIYIAFLSGGVLLDTWLCSGYMPPYAVGGIALIILQAVVMLTISMLGGTRLSTVANGVMAFMLYGLAFIGGWMEQIGSVLHNEAAVDIGIASSLLVPSEAMWKMAAYHMQPVIVNTLGVTPFSQSTPPSTAMLVYALLYVGGLLALAVHSFNCRDL